MIASRIIVAVACLSTAFASDDAGQSRRPELPRQKSVDLRPLVADLAVQLRLAYRGDVPEYTRRHEQLRAAISAWNTSSQNTAERQQLADWLRSAIRSSMPGSNAPFPPAPTFGRSAVEESDADDPFRDDPI